MMKRFILLCLAAIMGLSVFSGCGSDDDKNTLNIGFHKAGYGDALINAIIADFEAAYPEYNVVLNADEQYSTKVETQLQTEQNLTTDDLLLINSINFYNHARDGKLVELSDVYAQDFGDGENTIESALSDPAKTACKAPGPDGTIGYYTMPTGEPASSFVLNRTLANYYEEDTGGKGIVWKTSKAKKIDDVQTVDDFMKWIKYIMELSATYPYTYKDGNGSGPVKGFVYCGQYMNYWDSIYSTWWAQYSGYDQYQNFYEMESVDVFSDKGRQEAYEAFEKLDLANTAIADSGTKDHLTAQNDLIAGRAAVMPNGQWVAYESRGSLMSWGVELEMIKVPYVDKDHKVDYLYCGDVGGAYIPNRPDCNVELAKKFLAFYMNYQNSYKALQVNGGLRPFYKGYTDEAVENMDVYTGGGSFVDGVIRLRNSAESLIFNVPGDASAPNWKILRTATPGASKYPDGYKFVDIINGEITAEQAFNAHVIKANDASNGFNQWLYLNGLN